MRDNFYNPNSVSPFKKGEEFLVNVMDQLTDPSLDLGTSIVRLLFYFLRKLNTFYLQHWHGIKQRRTNYVDGTVGVTQCPLIPDENFVYRFNPLDQAVAFSCFNREILN